MGLFSKTKGKISFDFKDSITKKEYLGCKIDVQFSGVKEEKETVEFIKNALFVIKDIKAENIIITGFIKTT